MLKITIFVKKMWVFLQNSLLNWNSLLSNWMCPCWIKSTLLPKIKHILNSSVDISIWYLTEILKHFKGIKTVSINPYHIDTFLEIEHIFLRPDYTFIVIRACHRTGDVSRDDCDHGGSQQPCARILRHTVLLQLGKLARQIMSLCVWWTSAEVHLTLSSLVKW